MENVIVANNLIGARSGGSRASLWIRRVTTGLVVAFLLFDASMKLISIAPVVEATRQLGYSVGVIRPLGLLLLLSTLLYVIPRTRLVGALLLTAYLGGATAAQVRAGGSFWFPVATGAIIWITYTLGSPSLRGLLLSPQGR